MLSIFASATPAQAAGFRVAGSSKYSRGGGTVREQFENSSRVQFVISSRTVPEWGMNMKGEGLEVEFSSSSRCLGSFF